MPPRSASPESPDGSAPSEASAAPAEDDAPLRPRDRQRTSRRRTAVVASIVAVALVIAGGAWWLLGRPHPPVGDRVTASEGSDVSDEQGLITDGGRAPAAWTAGDDPVGAWVQVSFDSPTAVDRVRLVAADGSPAVTSGLLTLDGGAGVMVTAGSSGSTEVSFPQQTVTSARFTVASGEAGAGLARLLLDDDGDPPATAASASGDAAASTPLAGVTATASSSRSGSSPEALVDGDLPAQQTGREWRAASSDSTPWVQLAWSQPQLVTAVQVFGPSERMADAASSGSSPLSGTLEFSDGSSVVVSGIEGGGALPTTVAVAPRTATSVRLSLKENFASASAALREVAVYTAGSTPVPWKATGTTYEVTPPTASDCSASSSPVGSAPAGQLALVCPAVGTEVTGSDATVVVQAEPGAQVTATTQPQQGGDVQTVGTATAGGDGRATLTVDTSTFPAGPFALEVTQASGGSAASPDPLHLQLVKATGQPVTDAGHAPKGMTLQWQDGFDTPLSVSGTGAGAVYAAGKPESWGTSQFGDAVFADPATGAGTVATIPGGYLRLRAEPKGDLPVDAPYGQQHVGGLLSSARVGAGGFSAQYGYFEARMLAGAGKGTWPAFWMLNSQAATTDNKTAGEVDAVELYGHDTSFTCHTLHDWGAPDDAGSTGSKCLSPEQVQDWALGWHDYGVRVTPDGAQFYIDGQLVADKRGLGRSGEPFFFLLDMALGGGWPVALDPTGGTSDLYVDWVRVYT